MIKKTPIINVNGERVIDVWKERKRKELPFSSLKQVCKEKGYFIQSTKEGIYSDKYVVYRPYEESFLFHKRRGGWYVSCHEQLGTKFIKIGSKEQLKQFIDLLEKLSRHQISKEVLCQRFIVKEKMV